MTKSASQFCSWKGPMVLELRSKWKANAQQPWLLLESVASVTVVRAVLWARSNSPCSTSHLSEWNHCDKQQVFQPAGRATVRASAFWCFEKLIVHSEWDLQWLSFDKTSVFWIFTLVCRLLEAKSYVSERSVEFLKGCYLMKRCRILQLELSSGLHRRSYGNR